MRIRPFKLNAFEGVGAGQVAYTKLPNGPTYQEIALISNVPENMIEKITVDLGGVHQVGEIIEVTASDLVARSKYFAEPNGVGMPYMDELGPIYIIPFGSREAQTDVGQMMSGLVTLPQDNILIKVSLRSDLTAEKTVDGREPQISAYAYASASRTERTIIPMIKPQHISVSGPGELDYMNIPSDLGVEYRRFWLSSVDLPMMPQPGMVDGGEEMEAAPNDGVYLDKVEIWKDGVREFEETKDLTEFIQKREGHEPQYKNFCIDFVVRGWVMADTFKPQHRSELKMRLKINENQWGNLKLLTEGYKVVKAQS